MNKNLLVLPLENVNVPHCCSTEEFSSSFLGGEAGNQAAASSRSMTVGKLTDTHGHVPCRFLITVPSSKTTRSARRRKSHPLMVAGSQNALEDGSQGWRSLRNTSRHLIPPGKISVAIMDRTIRPFLGRVEALLRRSRAVSNSSVKLQILQISSTSLLPWIGPELCGSSYNSVWLSC